MKMLSLYSVILILFAGLFAGSFAGSFAESFVNLGRILHISDIHLDTRYHIGGVDNCVFGETGLGCCREFDIPKKPYGYASEWGNYNCDAPIKLVNETFRWIRDNIGANGLDTNGLDANGLDANCLDTNGLDSNGLDAIYILEMRLIIMILPKQLGII